MCFSPEADLAGGVVIGGVGIDAIRHIGRRPAVVAIAALPLILGFHQLDEAFVWWAQQGHIGSGTGTVALWVYLLIALVLLPVYVPFAVLLLEPPGRRRSAMAGLVLLGAGVGGSLLVAMLQGPIGVAAHPYHLSYSVPSGGGPIVIALYVIAVCGALLLSASRAIALFGVANLVAVVAIALMTLDGFASVWCAWAALTSGIVAVYLRASDRRLRGVGAIT